MFLSACTGTFDDGPTGGTVETTTTESAVLVGSLTNRFDDTLLGGGVALASASMSGREDGVVNTTATIR